MQLDAAERLLRLPLKGAAERDIPRVILHCCLQEKAWNPFYAMVMNRVAAVSKTHKTTLQFMAWDKLKALDDMNMRQSLSFGRFLAAALAAQVCCFACVGFSGCLQLICCAEDFQLLAPLQITIAWQERIASSLDVSVVTYSVRGLHALPQERSGTRLPISAKACNMALDMNESYDTRCCMQNLPMSTLKVVDFAALSAKHTMFWRLTMQHLLAGFKTLDMMDTVISRSAGKSNLQASLRRFLKTSVGPWVAAGMPGAAPLDAEAQEALLLRVRRAEKVLAGKVPRVQP